MYKKRNAHQPYESLQQMNDSFDEKLEQLKALYLDKSSYTITETVYKRFLRGYKENVENALRGLLRTTTWREEHHIDDITLENCANYHARRVAFIEGYDNQRRPIVNCIAGRHDRNNRDINEVRNFIPFVLDRAIKLSNPDIEQITLLFDLSDFSTRCIDLECLRVFIDTTQTHYPEILAFALVVNAPFIFWAVWEIIRYWLDPVTAAKVRFISAKDLKDFVNIDDLASDVKSSCKLTI